jgi:hypothetical protein
MLVERIGKAADQQGRGRVAASGIGQAIFGTPKVSLKSDDDSSTAESDC